MPELPEVITVTRHMNDLVKNKIIKDVKVNLPKMIKDIEPRDFINNIKDTKVLKVFNEGKWIIFQLDNNKYILNHLRLEGKFRTEHVEGVNPKHDHVIFIFKDGTELRFNDTRQFGTFHLKDKNYLSERPLSNLGKYLENIDASWLKERLKNKSIAIKTAMLDQTIVIGLGNIYINEVLWKIGLKPATPANKLTSKQYEDLIETSINILNESIKLGGSSIATYSSLNGVKGKYQHKLKVHGKQNEPCPRCKTPISKMKVNGRGTYYCSKCQK